MPMSGGNSFRRCPTSETTLLYITPLLGAFRSTEG